MVEEIVKVRFRIPGDNIEWKEELRPGETPDEARRQYEELLRRGVVIVEVKRYKPGEAFERVARAVKTVEQEKDCRECFEWADEVARGLCDSYYDSTCDCDEYDDACYADCAEMNADTASLHVTERVYYDIAPYEKPECVRCLQSWEAKC